MGTQQTLLIILAVIVVGVSISVGYSMYRSHSFSHNRSLIGQDMQYALTHLSQAYKLVTTFNGISRNLEGVDADAMAGHIGWLSNPMTNANGSFLIVKDDECCEITVKGIGFEEFNGKRPAVQGVISFPSGETRTELGAVGKDVELAEVELF